MIMNTDQGETISDIQNYLHTFNKEVESVPSTQIFVSEEGQYFYHDVAVNGQVVTTSEESKLDHEHGAKNGVTTKNDESDADNSLEDAENVLHLPQSEVVDKNQVILNAGDNSQIVTIVPSSTNPGEVSYVLIVEQAGDVDKAASAVYDFDEGDEAIGYDSGEDEEKKVVRIFHKKSQTVTQAHMCNYCNYTSPKRYLLSRHMRSHSEERPHKCSVCDRGFKTLASLQNHVNTHTGNKPHSCKFCDSTFTTSGELVRHVRYMHTHEKPHKCPECDYASVELSKLKRHMRCHTGERPYECSHCTYASPDSFKLKRHLRIHTGEKPYECETCRAKFTQSNSLKAHRLIHTGKKPVYACDLCPTTCGRKTDLRIHVQKLHTSDKPFKCKKCGKVFPDRYTYKQHNKTHEGEKCYKCDLCPYASVSSRHLESHMLIHTEQKPYLCHLCEQSFRQKQLLKRHQNIYHTPDYVPPVPREKNHECPECSKAFRHKGNLMRHMSIHDPINVLPSEKSYSAKLSAKKRYQLLDGASAGVFTSELDDEVMAVEGADGNQYVILEVIQLQDGENNMMSECLSVSDASLDGSSVLSSPLVVPHSLTADHHLETSNLLEFSPKKEHPLKIEMTEPKKESQKEMDSCFGFDDDDESAHLHLQFGD